MMKPSVGEVVRWTPGRVLGALVVFWVLRGGVEAKALRNRGRTADAEHELQPERKGEALQQKGVCATLGLRCGGMGGFELPCCEGLVCKEQDAFFSGYVQEESWLENVTYVPTLLNIT
jgi:hypothetical protein